MSASDSADAEVAPPPAVPPNVDEMTKSDSILKKAQEEMSTLDVLVCGKCHSVFHYIEGLQQHKPSCDGNSPVRDSMEEKAQVWAFLMWKWSMSPNETSSWKLYQQWCHMEDHQRSAWIAAGQQVQQLSRFSNATVTEVKVEPQVQPTPEPPPIKIVKEETEEISTTPTTLKKYQPNIITKKVNHPLLVEKESVRLAQERVPAEDRIARRSERPAGETGCAADPGEYVVEKILAKRFNPRRKCHEYLLKWEGYPHEQNTWEPIENMETCKHLLDAFEKQLARQKELKALRAAKQAGQNVTLQAKPSPVSSTPLLTPSGRLQRSSKARALDQVKAWCGAGAIEEPPRKKLKQEASSDEDPDDPDVSPMGSPVGRRANGATSDAELVKSLGLGGAGMPPIKGVIKVDPQHMPSLKTGVYIMSKNSGIMKVNSPGKLGPGLDIDTDTIRKQLLAAKQATQQKKNLQNFNIPVRKPGPVGQQVRAMPAHLAPKPVNRVIEKTIITPSGQKIIQRTIQKQSPAPQDKSPINVLNRKLQQQQKSDNSLLRRAGTTPRGRGRPPNAPAQIVRVNNAPIVRNIVDMETVPKPASDEASNSSDGVEDPWPAELGPVPSPSPPRDLTLDPETGKRLARPEGEPTPPPTPPLQEPPSSTPLLMKVEMSPGGTTGVLVQGDGTSMPVLGDEETAQVECKQEEKKLLSVEGVLGAEGEEVALSLQTGQPMLIRGEDGVLYQVAGENEEGQTLLVAAEGLEGMEGVEGAEGNEDVVYVTREDGQQMVVDTSSLGLTGGGVTGLQQVTVQVEGEGGEEATQVVAQLVQADPPSPGGTRRVVLMLPDGSFTMTELDKDQYDAITEGQQ